MKVRTGASLVCFSLSVLFPSAPAVLSGQALAEAAQATAPAAQTSSQPNSNPAAPSAASAASVQTLMQPAAPSTQDAANDLSVTVGKSVVLDLARPITRIVVGLGDFAEATAVSPTQVLVNGKTAGETTLILWDTGGGRQFFNVTVRASTFASHDQLETVRRQLRAELPGQDLSVTTEGGNVYLRGTVNDLNSSSRAVLIAATAGKVVNLLNVKVPAPERQILLKVRFASIDRTKEKQLGINVFSTGLGNTIGAETTGQFAAPTVTPIVGGAATALAHKSTQPVCVLPRAQSRRSHRSDGTAGTD